MTPFSFFHHLPDITNETFRVQSEPQAGGDAVEREVRP